MMLVWPSVSAAFLKAISNEGCIPHMYLDVRGLVTTGRGDLVDPMSAALTLPWSLEGTDDPAPEATVIRDWNAVKNRQYLRDTVATSPVIAGLTTCRLTQAAIDKLDLAKCNGMAETLTRRCPQFPFWPADAQLALLRWAWANGPLANYPVMFSCLSKEDFAGAADEASWANENDDVKCEIRKLFCNAAGVRISNLDPSSLLGDTP